MSGPQGTSARVVAYVSRTTLTPAVPSSAMASLAGLARQMGWSFTSRVVAAALQLVVIVMLARGLDTSTFAHVATANVLMMAIVPLNGFGLMRQLQLRRSLDPDDPSLPAVFAVWQRFMLGSVVIWLAGCVGLWAAHR